MRVVGLARQNAALPHAKAVLFVHNGQTQPGELHALAEDGVGTHDEVGLVVPDGGEGGAACGGFHAAGEQQHGNVRQAVRLAVQQFLHLAAIRLSTVLRFRRVSRRDLSTFIHNRMVR